MLNHILVDTERWIDPDDIKYRSPEEIEEMRQKQMSDRERMIEQKYKQVMFAEGKKDFSVIFFFFHNKLIIYALLNN